MTNPATPRRSLVTGGAGFIGSHLVEALIRLGGEVVVVDNLATGRRENLPSSAQLIVGDVGNNDVIDCAIAGCDCVFHLAAVSSVQDSLDRPMSVHEANLTASLRVLEAAVRHGAKRFVFSSSAAVYGDTGASAAREAMTPAPLSHYAVQKLASENYCKIYHSLHGLETVALRYFNIFGPRQRADSPYSGVMARFVDAMKNGRDVTIYGTGDQMRDFCHVDNVVAANIGAATQSSRIVAGRVFNIGTGASVSIRSLAEKLRNILGSSGGIILSDPRRGEIAISKSDISEARNRLNYEPISFEVGLTRFLRAN